MANYLGNLATEYRLRGRARFFDAHPASSVIIGLGIVGALNDRERDDDGTFKVSLGGDFEYFRSEALVDRVWFLTKKPHNRHELRIVVGRTADSDVSIPDLSIAVEHCAFVAGPFGLKVMDLGSVNATVVDGTELNKNEAAPLHSGSKIIVGRFEFEYLRHTDFVDRLRNFGLDATGMAKKTET